MDILGHKFGKGCFDKVKLVQGSPEWHEFRRTGIGASDMVAIMGKCPHGRTAYDVWLEKKGRKPPSSPNRYMIRGTELEPIARSKYMYETEIVVEPIVVKHKTLPFFASLDGLSFDEEIVFEAKCPNSVKSVKSAKNEPIRVDYKVQNQMQLLITGAKMGHIYLYHPECDAVLKEDLPEEKLFTSMVDIGLKFWDLVVNDIEPERVETKCMQIDDMEYVLTVQELIDIRNAVKQLDAKEKEVKQKILAFTDGGNFEGAGIRGVWQDGRITVDIKGLCERYGIKDEAVKEFSKQGNPYIKIDMV